MNSDNGQRTRSWASDLTAGGFENRPTGESTMSSDSSGDARRHLLTAASAIGLGALVTGKLAAATQNEEQIPRSRRGIGAEARTQDGAEMPRSRRISEEVVVGSSVAKSSDYNEAKNHSLIQVIEHVFKED